MRDPTTYNLRRGLKWTGIRKWFCNKKQVVERLLKFADSVEEGQVPHIVFDHARNHIRSCRTDLEDRVAILSDLVRHCLCF